MSKIFGSDTEAHLEYVTPEGLSKEEINGFFQDPSTSWRPYAAQMPWSRDDSARKILTKVLRDLDRDGPEASRIFYIRAESGAGATTFLRDLAFGAAMDGYPTLIATHAPFTPSGRSVVNFINSCLKGIAAADIGKGLRDYDTPWLIAFDRSQWEGREEDIATFARQITEAGRKICDANFCVSNTLFFHRIGENRPFAASAISCPWLNQSRRSNAQASNSRERNDVAGCHSQYMMRLRSELPAISEI